MSLYQSAVDNFPEDQATMDAEFALDMFKVEGRDYYHQWLIKERSCVIHNTFDDDEALIKRYIDKFNELTSEVTNLYM
jgi:adenylate kinase family enzyme